MTKVVTPSSITPGQIGKIQELLAADLRKSEGLPSEFVQQIIETQGDSLVAELVSAICRRVEAVSNLVVRRVKVDRSRTPQQILDATGRRQYTDPGVVKAMPRGEGEEAEVHFFRLGRYVSDDDLVQEFDLRGLKPTDPYSLAVVNEADPVFADNYPNDTHWKDSKGNWCYIAFDRWDGERIVLVLRTAKAWDDSWWFAGSRK